MTQWHSVSGRWRTASFPLGGIVVVLQKCSDICLNDLQGVLVVLLSVVIESVFNEAASLLVGFTLFAMAQTARKAEV